MARPATGREFVETAKARIASAKTVDALRAAQALLLPLEFGLSLEQTAVVIGLSKSRTGKLRTRFQRIECGVEQVKTKKGLRNHARMSLDEEEKFLAPFVNMRKIPARCLYPNSRLNLNGVWEEKFLRRLFISCFAAMDGRSLHISRGQRKRRDRAGENK